MYAVVRLFIVASVVLMSAHAQWQSPYYRDHVLVGKVYDLQAEEFIAMDDLIQIAIDRDIILLGETHSNRDHHVLQAQIIQALLARGHSLTLSLEMLIAGNQVTTAQISSTQLIQHLDRLSPGWDWPVYQAVIDVARDAQLSLFGANINKSQQLKIMRAPQRCQFDIQNHQVNLCQALPLSQQEDIKQTIFHAHCGYMPIEHTQGMAHVQMAKDLSMAIAVATLSINTKAVLLAGSAHVRKDIGVAAQLDKLAKTSLSVGILPVHPDLPTVTDYWTHDAESIPFDVVIFTPSDSDQDPCVQFSEQLKKMRTH